ncbi:MULTISPECIES: MoxR family ATPase [Micromonospora]|uniref:MoxR family ATPase n=1 Tax=Micromonospora solifontis TaxID=2487138 RepID=A0ABX9WE10_9ACTN|nr:MULTISPECIES: MoxR family ATPase [Micromonospora]NES17002.1 MoxR family ATPase [Micromonospora sp. PPF5-17B]NES38415.1 MoxR family ATPase [Micromonospora solifontis]NES58717.1 MoxR family ATPase [Micromonospora sp. PPF5-6]RNL95830.1 MoxR family ATPase [Micromonospora solifontis]
MTTTTAPTAATAQRILDEVSRVVVGKRDVVESVLQGIVAGGHILIEDLPGLGKTLIARSLAAATGLDCTRVQFTPDLLPTDLLGATVYDPRTAELTFRPGPVFANLLLADEINRTPPKTQAALLEAMAERQVTVDGHTRPLPDPFVVLATDNPIEYEGTYPLPEAQLDRFLLRVRIGYLPRQQEIALLARRVATAPSQVRVDQVATPADLLALRAAADRVTVDTDLLGYLVDLLAATRTHASVAVGASPRGGLALLQLARAQAVLRGRDYVTPHDLKELAVPTLAHRLTLRPEMWVRRVTAEEIVTRILDSLPVPRTGSRP